MNILKTLQRLEAASELCSGNYTFLKCQKILKDHKSEQNPLKMLKGLTQPTHYVNLTKSYGYILVTYISYFLLRLMLRNLNYVRNSNVVITLAQLT